MSDLLAGLFGPRGALQTGGTYSPGSQTKMDSIWDQFNQGNLSPDQASAATGMVEKGSILGMTPSTFASVAGQLGSAISPKDSWQSKLGSVAAQMGSQKLSQLMQAEKERRATDLWKQILKQTSNKQLAGMGAGLPETGIPKSLESQMSMDIYNQDLTRNKNQS